MTTIEIETTPEPQDPTLDPTLPDYLRPRLDGSKGLLRGLKGVRDNTPVLRLHIALLPTPHGVHPPVLHYGFPFDIVDVQTYGLKYGTLVTNNGSVAWGSSMDAMFAHILATLEIKSFKLSYAGVIGAPLCLCLRNNYNASRKVRRSEVGRLQAYFGLAQPAMWYVDHEMWYWGRKIIERH